MNIHLAKLCLCFDKCRTFGISFNFKKMHVYGFSRIILGYIVFKECKLLDPKRYRPLSTCWYQKPPRTSKSSMVWLNFINVSYMTLPLLWPPSPNSFEKPRHLNGLQNVKSHGKPSSKGTLMPKYSLLLVGIWNFMFIWMHPIWRSMPCWHKTRQANVINQWLMHPNF